jgi:hypothetical protein
MTYPIILEIILKFSARNAESQSFLTNPKSFKAFQLVCHKLVVRTQSIFSSIGL